MISAPTRESRESRARRPVDAVAPAGELGIDPRFVIDAEIGRGAASRVFAVHDRLTGVGRALKIATQRGQVRQFKTEFRHLSEMRHPNIVRSYDFGRGAGGMPYYTQELVRGVTLGELEQRWDAEVLALIAMQILDALATIHARGWVHRDVKPDNLLTVGSGAAVLVRLVDLGLLAPAGERSPPAGTLPYIAPEVARGDVCDGRADLYSLGVVLYEALLPEDAPATLAEVARRLSERPPPPNRINPTIPTGISDFIVRLLEPDPAARFAGADQAAEALSAVPGLHIGRGPQLAVAERVLRGGAISHRDGAVARVRRWARQTIAAHRGGISVVSGPVGVGKTPFLREVGMLLSLQGFRVLRLRADAEPGTPIPALLQAAQALRPGSRLLPDPGPMPLGVDAASSKISEFARRLGSRLARALGDRPTVVIIDDLHRAEPVSLDVLRSLGHELSTTPVLLICAGDQRSDGVRLEDALGPDAEVIEIGPLSRAEIERLAAHRLNGLILPPPAAERLAADSQGMPSLVERTLARLLVDRTVQREGSRWVFVGGRYRPARHEDAELIAARVARVKREHRDFLAAAAVLGHGLTARRVAAVAGTNEVEAATALADLARLQILNAGEATRDPSYLFASRSLRGAIYNEIPTATRRAFHDRAAGVHEEGEATAGRAEERTEHLLKGSDDAKAIAAAMDAGDRAAAVFADRRAIEYYARAYSRLEGPDDPRALEVALRLGVLFERSGELERASVWYTAAAGTASGGTDIELEAILGLAGVALVRGIPAETARHAERALELIGDSQRPRLQASARRLLALVAMQSGDLLGAAGALSEALDDFEAAGAEREVIEVLLDLARLARQRGAFVEAVGYARRALHRAQEEGEPAAIAEAHTVLGRGFLQASRFTAARRALSQALGVARQSGDRLREAWVLREMGNLRTRQADFAGALERYNRSLELARAVRARADEARCLHNIGVVTTSLGQFRGALSALRAALDVANQIGDVQGSAYTYDEIGNTYCQLGAFDEARYSFDAALRTAVSLDDPVLAAEAHTLAAWVDLCRGVPEAAEAVVRDVFTTVADLEDPADRAMVLLYAARAAVRLRHVTRARAIADRLGEEIQRGVLRDFEAAAAAVRGDVDALEGDRERALAALSEAARMAMGQGLRPLEVGIRLDLGRLAEGTDAAVEHLTRGMEVLREIVGELPPPMAAVYLGTAESLALRHAFSGERRRLLG